MKDELLKKRMDEEIIKLKADHEFRKQMREADEKEKPKKTKKKNQPKQYKIQDGFNLFQENKDILAEQFNKIQPYFYDKSGLWWFWNEQEKKYDMIDEYDIINLLKRNSPHTYFQTSTNKFYTETIRALKIIGRSKTPKNTPETWIQFKNKIIDIETGRTHEATPKYFNTNPIPYKIGETLETPELDKILIEWVGEKNVMKLKQVLSYCMLQNYPIHRIICLTGSGLNGKGEYLRLIKKMIGSTNCTSTELDLLMMNRFETAKLYKKLVCIMGETNFAEISKTSMLKKLTGQDLIGYEFKNKNPFDDVNYAKLLISTNSLPPTTDKTDGFYRRWLIIDFPNKFPEGINVLKRIPVVEYENFCLQSIDILKGLLEKGTFDNEGDIHARRKNYEQKSNPLDEFIKENYKSSVDGKVPFFEFYDLYCEYLAARGLRKLSKKHLGKIIRDEGYDMHKENVMSKDNVWTKWFFIFGLDPIDLLEPYSHSNLRIGGKWEHGSIRSNESKQFEPLTDNVLTPCSICGTIDVPCKWINLGNNDYLCDDCKKGLEVNVLKNEQEVL